ncbi:TIGR02301 family protein [Bosea vaviloviae]|uniref:TIGR02301 family protein n=1 Tax=Bosea vaviloviae TaxID=1526658 RepID=UPI0006BAFAB0|nr:TIGR02301 family protein [Bosea vaviloviae]
MKRAALCLLAVLTGVLPGSILAQQRPPATTKSAEPAPEPPPPPYEPQLLKLSEIMGSLAYLRTLCAGKEAQDWRDRMAALVEAEGRTPARRERLTAAYNRGFRAYSLTHRACTEGSQEASTRLAGEGERLARVLASRYGG